MEHIGRKGGKKRNAAAETRSRNKRVAKVERGTGQEREREGPQRERVRQGPRKREGKKEHERKGGRKRDVGDRKCERQRGDAGDRVQLPTYLRGGEERLVCSGLHHPREPTPGRQPPLFFQRSFYHPPFSSSCLSSRPSSSLRHIKHTFPGLPSVVFLSFSLPSRRENKFTRGGGEGREVVSLPPSSRPRSRGALNVTN